MNDWNRLDRHVVSGESIGSFKRWSDQSMDRDDRWDGYILDDFKGGRQGTAACISFLYHSCILLISYILIFLK